jgi:LPXTG-motif cell wall-anchored protein
MKKLLKMMLSALTMALLTVSVWAEEILLIAPAPKTGDRMNMPVMIGLVAVAFVAIIVLVVIMIRNNKK